MLRALRSLSLIGVVFLSVLAFCLLPSWAKDKPANDYPLSGKVLSSSSKGARSYQVETDSRIYLLLCEKVRGYGTGAPECKVDDRPIANGDTVQFRVDGDFAYIRPAKGAEDGLRILSTELKVIPPLPASAAAGNGNGSRGDERGTVIGIGMHILGQNYIAWPADPSSVQRPFFSASASSSGIDMPNQSAPGMPTRPVGGAPMMGAPVMGMPTGGARMGVTQANDEPMSEGPPPWVHLLRVKAGRNIYQLECSTRPCAVDKKEIGLGDTLVIRAEKKWAYVSSGASSGRKEERLRILSETEANDVSDGK